MITFFPIVFVAGCSGLFEKNSIIHLLKSDYKWLAIDVKLRKPDISKFRMFKNFNSSLCKATPMYIRTGIRAQISIDLWWTWDTFVTCASKIVQLNIIEQNDNNTLSTIIPLENNTYLFGVNNIRCCSLSFKHSTTNFTLFKIIHWNRHRWDEQLVPCIIQPPSPMKQCLRKWFIWITKDRLVIRW